MVGHRGERPVPTRNPATGYRRISDTTTRVCLYCTGSDSLFPHSGGSRPSIPTASSPRLYSVFDGVPPSRLFSHDCNKRRLAVGFTKWTLPALSLCPDVRPVVANISQRAPRQDTMVEIQPEPHIDTFCLNTWSSLGLAPSLTEHMEGKALLLSCSD